MEINKFKKDYLELILEMETRMSEPENDRYIIDDGVMLPEVYFEKDIKLAWILKEPYDNKDGSGGGWSYFDMFKGENLYLEQFNRNHKNTWHPIIYTSFSIHNNFIKYEDMDFIRDNHEMCNVVKEVAFINTQKLPSKGYTKTDFSHLHEAMSKYQDLLFRQIDLLAPNVMIYANTFHIYRPSLNLSSTPLTPFGSLNYIVDGDKLHIDAYHPGQTTVTGKVYSNDIISVIQKWKNGEL